jgi:hypothetical protein
MGAGVERVDHFLLERLVGFMDVNGTSFCHAESIFFKYFFDVFSRYKVTNPN